LLIAVRLLKILCGELLCGAFCVDEFFFFVVAKAWSDSYLPESSLLFETGFDVPKQITPNP